MRCKYQPIIRDDRLECVGVLAEVVGAVQKECTVCSNCLSERAVSTHNLFDVSGPPQDGISRAVRAQQRSECSELCVAAEQWCWCVQ